MIPGCSTESVFSTHIGRYSQPLAVGQSEQFVVVQHGVEVLHPLGVHVSVKDDPLSLVDFTAHVVNDPERTHILQFSISGTDTPKTCLVDKES